MQILLLEDYPALGFIGDRLAVKNGYARNFLIPKGIAVEASSKNAKLLKHRLDQIAAVKNKKKQAAEELKEELQKVALSFSLKIGEKGKSFGSISHRNIEQALTEKGYTFDRKQIKLSEPIKSGGSYEIEIKLHSEVTAIVPITVEAELMKQSEEQPAPAKSAKAGKGKKASARDAEASESTQLADSEEPESASAS